MARTTGTVSLVELIDKGLLMSGERLVIYRRSALPIQGVLQPDGSIRVGNLRCATPSKAAKLALNVRAVDGWIRWRVPRLDDKALAEIRGELR